MSLSFEAAFEALHGHKPYAWQRRLCAEVVGRGWPNVIAAPTGAGKTAVLDVALFHLATPSQAKAPRRIVFAVDRRVVVDQAFERAQHIQKQLYQAADGPLVDMRGRLIEISGCDDNEQALRIEELRGGLPREDDWARIRRLAGDGTHPRGPPRQRYTDHPRRGAPVGRLR
jgi:CRISPR-associated endonuclease/helicase Cas3